MARSCGLTNQRSSCPGHRSPLAKSDCDSFHILAGSNPNCRVRPQRSRPARTPIARAPRRLRFGFPAAELPKPSATAGISRVRPGFAGEISPTADDMADRSELGIPLWFSGESRDQDAILHADLRRESAAQTEVRELAAERIALERADRARMSPSLVRELTALVAEFARTAASSRFFARRSTTVSAPAGSVAEREGFEPSIGFPIRP